MHRELVRAQGRLLQLLQIVAALVKSPHCISCSCRCRVAFLRQGGTQRQKSTRRATSTLVEQAVAVGLWHADADAVADAAVANGLEWSLDRSLD